MFDSVLEKRGVKFAVSVKCGISALAVVLAVALPQIAHALGGANAGLVYLPMYLPVLLAGCLLGWQWGLAIGVISPLLSFGFTSLVFGSAMPAAARLPYMVLELAVFGGVGGAFSRSIRRSPLLAYPAVFAAQIAGRGLNFIAGLIGGGNITALTTNIVAGLTGLYLQAAIVPAIIILLAKALEKENE